jgi:hypothetical protein
VRIRIVTFSCVCLWRWAQECHQCDIDVELLRSPRRSYHPGQNPRNTDELGAVWVGDWLVRPPVRNSPPPREYGFLVRKTNPVVHIDVEGRRFLNDIAGSATNPHYGRVLAGASFAGNSCDAFQETEMQES